ncbi:MAG: hypothetical protein AAF430_19420 [Myxococcota bacterium]
MPRIEETIPPHLADAAEAARASFSRERGSEFKLTGILDPDTVPASDDTVREFQLILCGEEDGQDVCLRERFSISSAPAGFDVAHLDDPANLDDAAPEDGSPAPLLDPPAGVRSDWLEKTVPQHAFTVVLFYRGFW